MRHTSARAHTHTQRRLIGAPLTPFLAGIEVDLKIPPPKASALEVAVLRSGVLDEFAAQWCSKNEIKAGFKVTDDMYRQFQDMLAKKEASGDIPALTSLYSAPFDTLKKQLKESGYESSVSGLNNLKKSIRSEMSNDFNKVRVPPPSIVFRSSPPTPLSCSRHSSTRTSGRT